MQNKEMALEIKQHFMSVFDIPEIATKCKLQEGTYKYNSQHESGTEQIVGECLSLRRL